MERPIARKAIEANPQGGESPEDALFNSSSGDPLLSFSNDEDLDRLPSLDEGDGEGDSFPKYSLDDFPLSEPPAAAQDPSKGDSSAARPTTNRWASMLGMGFLANVRARKICLIVLSVLVVASGVGVTVRHYKSTPSVPKVDRVINKSLKRSITVPDYREQVELLVFVGGEQDRRLVAMQLEFGFIAENAFQDFQKDIVRFRDLSYQFVSREQPVRNTQKGWQDIVEKKLAAYLKASQPKSGLQSVRIAHWERL